MENTTDEKEAKALAALGQRLSTQTPNGNPLPGAIAHHQKHFAKQDAERGQAARENVSEDEAGTKAPTFSEPATKETTTTTTTATSAESKPE